METLQAHPCVIQDLSRRALLHRGLVAGLTMAVATLGVIAWATPVYGEDVARTMGLTVFSLANIWFAFETAHEEKSIVSAETLANPTLLKAGAAAIIATVAASELGLLNRILDTVNLTTEQWAICLVLSLAVVAVAEIKKLLRIRTSDAPQLDQPEAAAPAAALSVDPSTTTCCTSRRLPCQLRAALRWSFIRCPPWTGVLGSSQPPRRPG